MKSAILLAVGMSTLALSGCLFFESSGCPNVGVTFWPISELADRYVEVSNESLSEINGTLRDAFFRAAIKGEENLLSVPENEFKAEIAPSIKAVDPNQTHVWFHPQGSARLIMTVC